MIFSKNCTLLTLFILLIAVTGCGDSERSVNPFLHTEEPFFESRQLFETERFPNVLVATDGTVIATFGGVSPPEEGRLKVRRSTDGGETWEEPQILLDPIQWHGGGSIVDETNDDILIFAEARPFTDTHPAGQLVVFRSRDHGQSWEQEDVTIHPDSKGNIPSMHINERGITLQHGEYAGRLIRATRVFADGNEPEHWPDHYTNAIYSDDGGRTWFPSEPFPANGTGEAALEELSDGTIYYNSRRHLSTDGLNPRMRHIAWSYDGGEIWEDLSVSDVLPDGSQHRDYGLMAGLVRLPVEGKDILIYSNIDSDEGRVRGTVWASFDGGQSWPVSRLVDEGNFAYSSLAAGRTGTASEGMIYLLYEGQSGANIARFNLVWVLNGQDIEDYL